MWVLLRAPGFPWVADLGPQKGIVARKRKVAESSGGALFGIFSPHEFGTDGHRHQQKLLPYMNSFSRMHACPLSDR